MAGFWNSTIIHWHLNWDKNKKIFQTYEKHMNSLNKQIATGTLSKQFVKLTQKLYEGSSKEDVKKILSAAKYFNQNNEFTKKMEHLMEEIDFSLPMDSLTAKDGAGKMKEAEAKLEQYKDQINMAFETIYKFFGSNFNNIEGFFKYYATKDTNILMDLKALGFQGNNMLEIDSSQISSLNAKAKGMLRSLAQIYSKTTEKSPIQVYNSLKTLTSTLAGYGFEAAIEHSKEQLIAILKETLGPGVSIKSSADESDIYKTGTTDFKVYNNGDSQLKLKDMPLGISLKHSSSKSTAGKKIAIKGSTFGKMLDITMTNLQMVGSRQFSAMSNILLSRKRPDISDNAYSYSKGWRGILNSINKMLVVTGLAGSLTKNDFSTILIINNKAYNIYDIIENLFVSDDKTKLPLITPGGGLTVDKLDKVNIRHKWFGEENTFSKKMQKERSQNILNEMHQIPMNMTLWLRASLLNKLQTLVDF